jgi:phosphate transport system substrate-binding protein
MKSSRFTIALLALVVFGLSSCNAGGSSGTDTNPSTVVKLQGAGASFPAPLYTKWFKTHGSSHQNVQIDYQSVGSGSGVKSVLDKTVDLWLPV